MSAIALVLAAGQGVRLGAGAPKALVRVGGRSLLHWSAAALGRAAGVSAVLPVVASGGDAQLAELQSAWAGPAELLEPVPGGETRQASLAAGLAAVAQRKPDAEWVLVHDAARCLVEPADAEQVLAAAAETGAAIPIEPLRDTVKEIAGEIVVRTLDRAKLGGAQTPQAFRLRILREALEKAQRDGFQGPDCAALVERLGVEVRACPGRPGNFKVTVADDLARAEALLSARRERA